MLFTVAAPPKTHQSAGIMCLHELMAQLTALGHEVRQLDYTKQGEHEAHGILIAPEILPDIPIPHVRWVLNRPGLLGGPKVYHRDTMVFHYCPELEWAAEQASIDGVSHELMLGVIELPSIIPDSRPITCYYGGKFNGTMQDHKWAIEIRRDYPADKKKYWELLQQCHTLYSYDSFSAVNAEAHLMGVKVLVFNGTSFEPYNPPAYIDRLIWNEERNRAAVARFVDIVSSQV